MKVAYIVEPRKVIGGGVRAAINLAKSMGKYGAEASIFGVYKQTVEDQEVDFHRVRTLRPMSLAYFNAYRRFIKEYSPDIVHCLGLYTALLCLVYRKMARKEYAVVCTVHRVTMKMRFASVMKWVMGFLSRNLDYTTFLTDYQKTHYFENVGFRPSRYVVVPNVIYVQAVTAEACAAKREELIAELKADFLMSYVGRIIPSKNIEDTIRITALANRKGFNCGCVLVGGYSPEHYDKLQNLIRELHICEKIKFVGYVNTPSLYTASSDITTTTTTHGEALPNLLIESYALGKITVSSDIPQMVDLIENKVNGFTLPLSDLNGFVDVIQQIAEDQTMRIKMEKAARSTYEQKYAPEQVAKKYYEVYCTV